MVEEGRDWSGEGFPTMGSFQRGEPKTIGGAEKTEDRGLIGGVVVTDVAERTLC